MRRIFFNINYLGLFLLMGMTATISLVEAVSVQLPPDGLIVVPSDAEYGQARKIFITILDEAKSKIDLSMYQLKDQEMIDALIRASKRGVQIRIVTESNPYKHSHNQDKNTRGGLAQLVEQKIPIKNLALRFLEKNLNAQAHHKILIIDNTVVLVMSCNWDTPTLNNTRDFALIIDKNKYPEIFQEIDSIFEADWNNKQYTNKNPFLIVGPEHQREDFIKLFSQAKQTIEIYQQSYNDEKIAEALEKISNKGIKVKLLMMPFPFGGKKDSNAPFQDRLIRAGSEVRLVKTRYIHAKVVIVDGKIAYIGSCNFYPSSLDFNREVGVITQNLNAISRLGYIFNKDWEMAEPREPLEAEL